MSKLIESVVNRAATAFYVNSKKDFTIVANNKTLETFNKELSEYATYEEIAVEVKVDKELFIKNGYTFTFECKEDMADGIFLLKKIENE